MPILLKVARDELKEFPRDHRKYPKLKMAGDIDIIPSPGLKKVVYTGNVVSEEDSTELYRVSVEFFEVKFNDAQSKQYPISAKSSDGKSTIFFKAPNIVYQPIKLKCQCLDFRFRWEKELFDKKGLIGNWRRYKRKTPPPPVGYPYVNPLHLAGFCKHIQTFMVKLNTKSLIREESKK